MNKLLLVLLILCVWLSVNSCGKKDSPSTATSTTTDNSTQSVFIYAYSTTSRDGDYGNDVIYTCYGTNSSGYTSAPFYSTSTHDLKDRLPSSKWSYPVKSLQGHTISSSWENLWDGNIDMSLHQAEVLYDNVSSAGTGFWTGTKSDGTFSGNNCRDWSNGNTDNGTWGSLLINDNSSWINNGTKTCDSNTFFLCFMYN